MDSLIKQGVVKSYDPGTRQGTIMCDSDLFDYDLAPDALAGSVFRMLRPGQRVVFDVMSEGLASNVRLGSEVDMATPGYLSQGTTAPGQG